MSARNKLMSVCHASACPVIDHEFCYNIVKVAVDPRGDSRVDPQTTLSRHYRINFKFVSVRLLTIKISQ